MPVWLQNQAKTRLVVLALLASVAFLYLQVFILPATPRLTMGDQGIYLNNASRWLQGQIIYRDYDYFTLPGTDVLYALLFKLFGVRAWIPQVLLMLIGVVNVWLCIGISGKVLDGRTSFLPAALFLTLPFSSHLDATHHIYSAVAAIAALAIVIEKRTVARMTLAGTLWGLGTCFSQSMVVGVLGFAVFLLWERQQNAEPRALLLKKEVGLFGGFLAVITIFSSYFVWKAGLRSFLYYTVVFVAKYYSAYHWNTWRVYLRGAPSIHLRANWPDLPAWPFVHALIPFVYVFFILYYWRMRRRRPELLWDRLMLVNVTGLSLFLAVASAPAYNRLYSVSLPGIVLFVWLTWAFVPVKRILLPVLWAAVVVLTILKPLVTQMRWKEYLDLPTGHTAFFQPQAYEEAKWVAERTQPSDYFFGDSVFCFALELRNPARISFLTPTDFTRPEEVRDLVQALQEHQVRFVSWYAGLDASVNNAGSHLAPLSSYLHDHYRVGTTFSNGDKIWERDDVTTRLPTVSDLAREPGSRDSEPTAPKTAKGKNQNRN